MGWMYSTVRNWLTSRAEVVMKELVTEYNALISVVSSKEMAGSSSATDA